MDAFRKMSKWISITLLSVMLSNVALADTVTYFHNDISGSPMAATDSAGNLLWKENYRPYGDKINRSASSNENKIGFHGKPYDDGTGLSYMGARYYDPVLGRFMGVDPVDYQEDNLHSFNRYAYANNNPYKYVDPDGQFAILAIPMAYALAAIAVGYVFTKMLSSGESLASGNVSIGSFSYPGKDFGDSSQWARGSSYSNSDKINPVIASESSDCSKGSCYYSNSDSNDREKKSPKPGISGKDGAKDIPDWARGERPFKGESGKDFADRLLGDKYGPGNYPKGPASEHNKIRKYGDRSFK